MSPDPRAEVPYEPIAVVGIGCRLPGGVDGPDAFSRLLYQGKPAIGEPPLSRDPGLSDLPPHLKDARATTRAGWLTDVDKFDADFFGISPREARSTDPQQRLFLEVAWEALEHAGIPPTSLTNSSTGVYASVLTADYRTLIGRAHGIDGVDAHYGSGNVASFLSGRLSYLLGLRGPSITLDTACSSSLLAVHLAAQSLISGETDLALAGGVNLVLSPEISVYLAKTGALSPHGECRPFDAGADGTVRGEGCGVVVLKRLRDARAEGDEVLAVIRGSAVNHSGPSAGLTVPSAAAQTALIQTALRRAGLQPADVGFVEAHGTGTRLGDPTEATALGAGYGWQRASGDELLVGSVKALIGHLDSAAGIAGLIKTVLTLRHGLVPPQPGFELPNPAIKWEEWRLRVPTRVEAFQRSRSGRYAGVTSLGLSGTNVHLVLGEGATVRYRAPAAATPHAGAWPLSARSAPALQAQAGRLHKWAIEHPEVSAGEVLRSLGRHRAQLPYRAVVLGADRTQLLAGLAGFTRGVPVPNVVTGRARAGKLAFVFHGQGGQRPGMGKELYESYPAFADALDEVCAALDAELGRPLLELLFAAPGTPEAALLDQTEITQVAVFATQVALFRLLESCTVRPDYLLGHSLGEVAAVHLGGILTLPDAAKLVAARGRLMGALPAGGAMVALDASSEEVSAQLQRLGGRVSLAAVNGPRSTVISGDAEPVLQAQHWFDGQGRQTRLLRISIASHSHQMDPVLAEFEAVAAGLTFSVPSLPVVSCVTGEAFTERTLKSPAHWARNVREPVRFLDGIRWLEASGATRYLEVGTDGMLTAAAETCLADPARALVLPVLRKGRPDHEAFVESVARLQVNGVQVNWEALAGRHSTPPVKLPTYAFQRQRHWLSEGSGAADLSAAGLIRADHPLLAAVVPVAGEGQQLLTGRLSVRKHRWLADHEVLDRVLVPGTALLELAFHAAKLVGADSVEELVLQTPLVLPPRAAVQLQLSVGPPDPDGRREVAMYSRPEAGADGDGEWTVHATGSLAPAGAPARDGELAGPWPPAGALGIDLSGLYERLSESGFNYGASFQGLRAAWRRDRELFAEVSLATADVPAAERFGIHPALLDSALHTIFLGVQDGGPPGARLPFAWADVKLHTAGQASLRIRLKQNGPDDFSLVAADNSGAPVLTARSIAVRPLSADQLHVPGETPDCALMTVEWAALPADAGEPGADAAPALLGDLEHVGDFGGERYRELADLRLALDRTEPAPVAVLTSCKLATDELDVAAASHRSTKEVLALLQGWLADERLAKSELVLLTRGAVAMAAGERPNLAEAALWGLLRGAQSECPGRFRIIDLDRDQASADLLPGVLASGEPQLAIRRGKAFLPRLTRTGGARLTLPAQGDWRLELEYPGTLESLHFVDNADARRPLAPGEVRIRIQAAGLNFRDILVALELYPGEAPAIGGEAAGVVEEVGPGVSGLKAGDRVAGFVARSFAAVGVADQRLLIRLPDDWSAAQGASLPIAVLTAYHALVDLADLRAGEAVLVHAATGGVGMAAVQLARHLGAEVFATASPSKWSALRELGLDDDHIASSRTVDGEEGFRQRVLGSTAGRGVDVVLNSLTDAFIDASLELLPGGGRFIEIGKLDLRDPAQLATRTAPIRYQAFDLSELDPARRQEMLREVLALYAVGAIRHPPIAERDIRTARETFRLMSQAGHIGKLVLTIPQPADPEGTVLITGGTGGLGKLVARHLAVTGQARRLILTSRRGRAAIGAAELESELRALGAEVAICSCDAADRRQLADLLESIPAEQPLSGVIHAAGVIDDGVLTGLTPDSVDAVLRPKVDAALNLHELTQSLELREFVLFSSSAGILGHAGQANYAAANAFLDALAEDRQALGLAGKSVAWGLWAQATGMTGHLTAADTARLRSSGYAALSSDAGLQLFELARADPAAAVVAMAVDRAVLRDQAREGTLPLLLTRLVQLGQRDRSGDNDRGPHLASAQPQTLGMLELVRNEVARVLGHPSSEAIEPERSFKDLGLDSLGAVELRNRLAQATGVRLQSTLAFDFPTPAAVARELESKLAGGNRAGGAGETLEQVMQLIDAVNRDPALRAELERPLRALSARLRSFLADGTAEPAAADVDAVSDDELLDLVDGILGT